MKKFFSFSVAFALLALCAGADVSAQICRPVSERTGEAGCWITAMRRWPSCRKRRFSGTWTPTRRAQRQKQPKGPRGTVVESLGKVWLLTIDIAGWRPAGGARVAEIGPLPELGARHAAQYMEAIFIPGMTAPAHRHSGPEAWGITVATGEST